MAQLPSYLNVHPPPDPTLPLLTPPILSSVCPLPLAGAGLEEITISMIMTQMKLLKLITGHNTSFSALIRKLIGNRLVCFSRSTFPLHTVGLLRQIEKVIFQLGYEENLPPNLLVFYLSYLFIYLFSVVPHFSFEHGLPEILSQSVQK